MKRIIKVSKFNLSDIVADYEEIVSTRYFRIIKCASKPLSYYYHNPLGSLYFKNIMSHVKTAVMCFSKLFCCQ